GVSPQGAGRSPATKNRYPAYREKPTWVLRAPRGYKEHNY
ncbi:unnamed protein product, partial [marine sediment metagenome]